MKRSRTFLNLIRWPNLVIMAVTQWLLYTFLLTTGEDLPVIVIILTICATIFIAGGGYIINDLYDEKTDRINKPEKTHIGTGISRKNSRILYLLLTLLGLIFTSLLYLYTYNPTIPALNFLSVLLLYFYSFYFKGTVFLGNLIIALLSAWVVLILEQIGPTSVLFPSGGKYLLWGFAIFAFLLTLIRECIKDMEDMEGDKISGLNTLPIKYGIRASKNYAVFLIVLTGLALSVVLFYYLLNNKWLLGIYIFVFILLPLIYVLKNISIAQYKKDFSRMSILTKLIMGTGILSVIFFIN